MSRFKGVLFGFHYTSHDAKDDYPEDDRRGLLSIDYLLSVADRVLSGERVEFNTKFYKRICVSIDLYVDNGYVEPFELDALHHAHFPSPTKVIIQY